MNERKSGRVINGDQIGYLVVSKSGLFLGFSCNSWCRHDELEEAFVHSENDIVAGGTWVAQAEWLIPAKFDSEHDTTVVEPEVAKIPFSQFVDERLVKGVAVMDHRTDRFLTRKFHWSRHRGKKGQGESDIRRAYVFRPEELAAAEVRKEPALQHAMYVIPAVYNPVTQNTEPFGEKIPIEVLLDDLCVRAAMAAVAVGTGTKK